MALRCVWLAYFQVGGFDAIAALALGGIHRRIGGAHQFGHRLAVGGKAATPTEAVMPRSISP
jgi:hypothetical protein